MVAGFGAVDRGALLVIGSWCTDGALLLGRGPVKSHRASVRGGPNWQFPCAEPAGSDESWACHGRTSGRGGADPPPTGCLVTWSDNPGVTHPPLQAMAHRRPARPFASTGQCQNEANRSASQ